MSRFNFCKKIKLQFKRDIALFSICFYLQQKVFQLSICYRLDENNFRRRRKYLNVRHNLMTNLIIILLQIIVGLLAAYLLYYAQQKGKNQADKKDLQKLTEIVEEVKRKNNEELELLKSSLSLLSNRQLQIFSEEKDAIVKFFSQLNKWIWDSLNIQLNEFNHTNYVDLSTRIIKMRDAYNEVNVTFSNVQLLVSDDTLLKVGHETIIEILKLHQFKEGLALRLQRNLSWEKILVDQITSGKIDFQTISRDMQQFYISQAKDSKDERDTILKEYHERHKEFFSPAILKVHQFKELAKSYLRQ